jgi:hypothetical protein
LVGTQHTVFQLWEAQGNLEQQHAVYILASLWDKDHKLPERWRGKPAKLVFSALVAIHQQFPQIERWHPSSREALPVDLVADAYSTRMLVPRDGYDLMYTTALEAIMATATWQLIHYVPEPPPRLQLLT